MIGIVTSNKMKDAVVVTVYSTKTHPKYKRKFKSRKKYFATSQISLNIGQEVNLISIRPVSKNIRWKIETK